AARCPRSWPGGAPRRAPAPPGAAPSAGDRAWPEGGIIEDVRGPDLRRLRRNAKAEEKFLGPLEAEVMDRLWKRRSATVRDIVEDLGRSRQLAYTTVMTIMTRLHAKGLLARGAEDAADVVALVVLGLAFCGIALGVGTLFRQLGATAVLIRSLVSRKVRVPARVRAAASGLGLEGRVDVVVDDRPFSFCYWFLRPRICLSTGLVRRLERDELRAVLLHERYHLLHRDPLRLVVARYFAAGLYVIPVFDELPPLVSVPTLLVGPASLLFAAAVDGGLHQFRLVTHRPVARS